MSQASKIIYFVSPVKQEATKENRSSKRQKCWIKTSLATADQTSVPALLMDISNGGVRIKSRHQFETGEIVELVGFNFYSTVPCEVIWIEQNEIGLKFCA